MNKKCVPGNNRNQFDEFFFNLNMESISKKKQVGTVIFSIQLKEPLPPNPPINPPTHPSTHPPPYPHPLTSLSQPCWLILIPPPTHPPQLLRNLTLHTWGSKKPEPELNLFQGTRTFSLISFIELINSYLIR